MNDIPLRQRLICGSGPLAFGRRGPRPRPGVAVVYATKKGQAVVLSGRPSLYDLGRYQGWYLVDVSRHYDLIAAEVPSQVDSMCFQFEADVIWGVIDPALIVTHNTMDGLWVVQSRLLDQVRRISRQYDIEDCPDAERRLQAEYAGRSITLPEGLTLHSIVVRLRTDAPTAEFQHTTRQLRRTGVTDRAEYVNQRNREEHTAELEKSRMAALRRLAKGEDDLLFIFLSRHPDQVGVVLQAVAQRRELTTSAQRQLFDKMVDKGFIQEADIEPMRRLLLQPIESFVAPGALNPLSGGGAARASAIDASRPAPGDHGAAPGQPTGRHAPDDGNGVAGRRRFGPGDDSGS